MYCEYLTQPENVDEFIKKLKTDMEQALDKLNSRIPTNKKGKLSTRKGGRISENKNYTFPM